MAFCVKCGTQQTEDAKFCASCGTPAGGGAGPQNTRSSKDGEVIKCPSCGAPTGAMDGACSECGYEFRNRSAGNTIKEFFELYNRANMSEKADLIKTFPVPNTKEDILSFLTMGIGNTKGLSGTEILHYRSAFSITSPELKQKEEEIKAWRVKVRQVIETGKIMFKDNESQALFSNFEKELKMRDGIVNNFLGMMGLSR